MCVYFAFSYYIISVCVCLSVCVIILSAGDIVVSRTLSVFMELSFKLDDKFLKDGLILLFSFVLVLFCMQ